MMLEPLKGRMYFYEKCVSQSIKTTKTKIKELLSEIREELYPSGEEIALSDHYCRTQDETCSQTFLQYKGHVRIPQLDKKTILKAFFH